MPEQISEDDFRAEASAFLEANAKPRPKVEAGKWGEGTDSVGLLSEKSVEEEQEELRAAKDWKSREFDAGFGWITGPEQYGGRGLPGSYERLYGSLSSRFDVPSTQPFGIGLGMVAPTILAHATDEVKEAYLRKLYRGDLVACQLFSEPGAGSDLAGLQCRAVRDGEEWIVNGQKVWTSGAQYSDIGEIICRTDPSLPKHKGLTGFVVDMHAPGVEVRPLRQITGGASFNEVFFSDVRIPDNHRLGDVNQGWAVALTTLMNERAAIGSGGGGAGGGGTAQRLIELARHVGKSNDPIARQLLAKMYTATSVNRFSNLRSSAKMKAGVLPGPEMSISKMALTEQFFRIQELVTELLGMRLVADTGEWGTYAWSEFILGIPGMRIAGGTDEVLRNIVGERVLGLPKEPAVEQKLDV
jgi:alkylation response protein AidB-like acyl-CoA dehydrogenase